MIDSLDACMQHPSDCLLARPLPDRLVGACYMLLSHLLYYCCYRAALDTTQAGLCSAVAVYQLVVAVYNGLWLSTNCWWLSIEGLDTQQKEF